MASAMTPRIYDSTLADQDLAIATEDAYAMVKRLARQQGLLVGVSAGAAMAGCLRLAREIGNTEAVIVTVFPDAADKYLSERFWEE